MLTEKLNAFFDQMGAEWVLWLLLLLSVLSIAIIVERILFLRRNRVDVDTLSANLLQTLRQEGKEKARALTRDLSGMTGGVMNAAFDAYDDGVGAVEEVVAAAITRERTRYDRNLAILGTLGNNAPFIGLFGTVIGIINAFAKLAGALEGEARTHAVMESLSEALVATAVGLAVAIPAVIAYNAFKTRIKRIASSNEWLARNVLAHLKALEDKARKSEKG